MSGDTGEIVNHEEALQLAALTRGKSNLARCYLAQFHAIAELRRALEDAQGHLSAPTNYQAAREVIRAALAACPSHVGEGT